ncbi:unnamed protein product [Caretta caretta]
MTFLSNEKVTNATIPSQTEGERDGRSLSSDASPEASGAKLQSGAAVVLGQPGTEGSQCLAERGFKGKTLLLKHSPYTNVIWSSDGEHSRGAAALMEAQDHDS